jgi:hypothetical protein|nr:MAG TPA: hypothetical protein [Caudoviricetes sp.]
MNNEAKKTVAGLVPREAFRLEVINSRRNEIMDAIERYAKAEMVIPIAWIQELKYYEQANAMF